MPRTSDLECPHAGCDETLHVPLVDYVEGAVVTCPKCKRKSQLSQVPSPTASNLHAGVWDLKPLHTSVIGYIVVEPSLRVERVPDHLLDWEDLLWPAERNTMPEKPPGKPAATFKATELYHQYQLTDSDVVVYVWSRRDPNALPEGVTAEIRKRAKMESSHRQ